jgi:hypothetical protein
MLHRNKCKVQGLQRNKYKRQGLQRNKYKRQGLQRNKYKGKGFRETDAKEFYQISTLVQILNNQVNLKEKCGFEVEIFCKNLGDLNAPNSNLLGRFKKDR